MRSFVVNLECTYPGCGEEYSIDELNKLCIKCGRVLYARYDINAAKKSLSKEDLIHRDPNMWRYFEMMPVKDPKNVITLGEGFTPIFHAENLGQVEGYSNLYIKDEGLNPTGSFKDRGMTMAVSRAVEAGSKAVICASTGNTSASAGMFAANENMDCDVYIPEGEIAPGKLSQAYQFGTQLIQVKGNFDDAYAKSLEVTSQSNGYTVNSINPFRIEGQKTILYRALEFMNWEVPDWIVYPGGALGNTSSCGKAIMELYEWGWIKKIPRIAVINAEGANTLDVLYNGKFEGTKLRWNKGEPDMELIERYYSKMQKDDIRPKTKATAIQIGKPANIIKALRALEFTNGVVITVTDNEMLDGMTIVGLNGFDCEMASGSVPSGVKKLIGNDIIKKDDKIIGILTGRQKEPLLPINYHNEPSNLFARPPK